jgi:hypothetical protein
MTLSPCGFLVGHSGRVIAPVFKTTQAFDNGRYGRPMSRVSDDSAHVYFSSSSLARFQNSGHPAADRAGQAPMAAAVFDWRIHLRCGQSQFLVKKYGS